MLSHYGNKFNTDSNDINPQFSAQVYKSFLASDTIEASRIVNTKQRREEVH
jgi:hypothetical protein